MRIGARFISLMVRNSTARQECTITGLGTIRRSYLYGSPLTQKAIMLQIFRLIHIVFKILLTSDTLRN